MTTDPAADRQDRTLTETLTVRGPWSLATSRAFWEGFAPAALPAGADAGGLDTTFLVEQDWSIATVVIHQRGELADLAVTGSGDLEAAIRQTARFLSLDVDATRWPDVGARDPVIAAAQRELPGLRPCGFHSPYEAAVWSVLSQRIQIRQAARLRRELIAELGIGGAFPAPTRLLTADLDLPGRKPEYVRAVAEATLDGVLDATGLRALDAEEAVRVVQQIKGLGPFAAELVVLRGANHPDGVARHEARLVAEIAERYGPGAAIEEVATHWSPFRTWAAVHLRILRERRTREIGGPTARRVR